MNRNHVVGFGVFALFALAALWFATNRPEPEPERPRAKVLVQKALPKASPRVYTFPAPTQTPPPATQVAPEPEPQRPLNPSVHSALVAATNDAMGNGWRGCVQPWLDEEPADEDVPSQPLVVFFDMVDGRLSDIRMRSSIELPQELVDCFAEAVWQESFPEDPEHRGSVSVQRVVAIKK